MQAIQNTQLSIQALVESLARDRDRKLMLERLYHDAELELTAAPPGAAAGSDVAPRSRATAQRQWRLRRANSSLSRERRSCAAAASSEARASRTSSRANGSSPSSKHVSRRRRAAPKPADGSSAAVQVPPSPEAGGAPRASAADREPKIDSLERQIAFKEAEEKRLRDTLAVYQRRIEEIPGVESEWIALTRDYKTQQAAYENLLAKSEQSKVAVELERRQIGEQFRVLDPARPPVRPTGVNRMQLNAMGAAAGLMLGVALAALLEFRDRTFHSIAGRPGCSPAAYHCARSVRDARRGSPPPPTRPDDCGHGGPVTRGGGRLRILGAAALEVRGLTERNHGTHRRSSSASRRHTA